MATLTALELPEVRRLASTFGVDVAACRPLEAGSVNSNFILDGVDGVRWFARLYEEQSVEGALAERRLLERLSRAGVPTVVPLPPRPGEAWPTHGNKPFAIYPWVEGEVLCQGRVTPAHCRAVGEALARVHVASAQLAELPQGRFGPPAIRQRLASVRAQTKRFDATLDDIEERLAHYEALRDEKMPRAAVHGDLFRDNVLWNGELIAALIDFESASEGPAVFDLMVLILAWCYGDAFELDAVSALLEGYQGVRPLSAAEWSGLLAEGAIACLRFATTRITDFSLRTPEDQQPARDFRRFLQRLAALEGGALAPCFEGARR